MMTNPEIHVIDLNFQGMAEVTAAYLVVGPDGPILIETGPGSTLETLISQIRKLGFVPEQIKHVLVTHIHLDHAGAAGWWAQQGHKFMCTALGLSISSRQTNYCLAQSAFMATRWTFFGGNAASTGRKSDRSF